MSRKTALEREVSSLRDQIARMKRSHTETINAKNHQLEEARLGDVLFEVGTSFPHFRDLVTLLRKAHTAAVPLRSPTGDGRSTSMVTPLESGASTRVDRDRVDDINDLMKKLVDRIQEKISPKGPLEDIYRPQCWNPDCPSRAAHQAIDRTECISCSQPFGRYKPLNDLTRPADMRCWTRGCPHRGKIDQCVHSWRKMDVPHKNTVGA